MSNKSGGVAFICVIVFGTALRVWLHSGASADRDQRPAAWQTVLAKDGSCSVSMPGEPIEEANPEDTPQGKVTTYTKTFSRGKRAYTLGYADYPRGLLSAVSGNSNLVFDAIRDTLVTSTQATITEEKSGMFNGHPGRSTTVEFFAKEVKERVQARQICLLVKERIYVMVTILPLNASAEENADAARFRKSFALLTPGGAPAAN